MNLTEIYSMQLTNFIIDTCAIFLYPWNSSHFFLTPNLTIIFCFISYVYIFDQYIYFLFPLLKNSEEKIRKNAPQSGGNCIGIF